MNKTMSEQDNSDSTPLTTSKLLYIKLIARRCPKSKITNQNLSHVSPKKKTFLSLNYPGSREAHLRKVILINLASN